MPRDERIYKANMTETKNDGTFDLVIRKKVNSGLIEYARKPSRQMGFEKKNESKTGLLSGG